MGSDEPELLRWRVGDVTVTRVAEWVGALPHDSLLPGLTAEVADAHRPWIDPFVTDDGRMILSVHSFVLVSEGTTIVVDTCVGHHGDRPLPHDTTFPERLNAAIDGGLDAVDVVLCTHLHFDHVGWNTRRSDDGSLVPTFPTARYLVTADELATYADHDHQGIAAVSIAPLLDAGLLDAVAIDHCLTSEVRLVSTPGHTEGHVSVRIDSDGRSALITGDAIHHPVQIAHPEISAVRFDSDSDTAITTRRRLVAEYADTDTVLLGTHTAPPTAGHIVSDAAGGHRFRTLDERASLA